MPLCFSPLGRTGSLSFLIVPENQQVAEATWPLPQSLLIQESQTGSGPRRPGGPQAAGEGLDPCFISFYVGFRDADFLPSFQARNWHFPPACSPQGQLTPSLQVYTQSTWPSFPGPPSHPSQAPSHPHLPLPPWPLYPPLTGLQVFPELWNPQVWLPRLSAYCFPFCPSHLLRLQPVFCLCPLAHCLGQGSPPPCPGLGLGPRGPPSLPSSQPSGNDPSD